MFVQVIHGPVGSADEVFDLLDRWRDQLATDATGWLGSTGGVTPDGQLFLTARFASRDDARRNSDRPEQGAWWQELEGRFTGPVTFHDCDEVVLIRDGGADDAGFVQVMEWEGGGTAAGDLDADSIQVMADGGSRYVEQRRPDVIGGWVGLAADGTLVQEVYFTSEDEARAAERETAGDDAGDDDVQRLMERLGEPSYHDLPAPRMESP